MERRTVMLSVTRRQFLQFSAVSAAGLSASSLGVLGFSSTQVLAEVREYKLARTTETRNTCPYCSVGCGLLMYSLGDKAKNAPAEIIHIEGDPDHPVNRGTLCPKGAGLLDRKSTRLNSSHLVISYAVFCLKKKNLTSGRRRRRRTI